METTENRAEKLEIKSRLSNDVHANYASNENHDSLFKTNGRSSEFIRVSENSLTLVNHARPDDYVDYINMPSEETKDSERKERPSAEQQVGSIFDGKRTANDQELNPVKTDVEPKKKLKESIQKSTLEPVKRRKKGLKFRSANKIHSSPDRNIDLEIKVGQREEESGKRKTV